MNKWFVESVLLTVDMREQINGGKGEKQDKGDSRGVEYAAGGGTS
jgi:hypothetical protein